MSGKVIQIRLTAIALAATFLCAGAWVRADDPKIRHEKFVGSVQSNSGASVAASEAEPASPTEPAAKTDAGTKAAVESKPQAADELPPRGATKVERAKHRGGAGVVMPGSFVDMIWPLCVVLGALLLVAMVFKRWMPRSMRAQVGGGVLRIVARQALSPKQGLCLVRVGRRLVLLATTPDRVSAVSEISDPEEAAAIMAAAESAQPGSFTTALNHAAESQAVLPEVNEEVDSAYEDVRADAGESLLMPGNELASAHERVRTLLGRVRTASNSLSAPAEPVQRAVGAR